MTAPGKSGGAVAAGHPETVAAARAVLEDGGNAFDAAMAAMTAACVTEPVLSSLGGGGFLLARPVDGAPVLYDFFVQTPLARPDADDCDFHPILCDFGTTQQEFHIGMASMATPGAVRGLFEITRDLGRMPLARVVEPALHLARDGFEMNRLQAYIFNVVGGIYVSTEASRAIFRSKKDADRLIGEGERMCNPDFADALETLSIEGEDLFYRGEMAAQVDRDCRAGGGTLSRADFENYHLVKRKPLEQWYRGARILTNPPPSNGGILIAFALSLLQEVAVNDVGFGSKAYLELLAEVMALTNKARVESRLHEVEPWEAHGAIFAPDLLARYRDEVIGHPAVSRGTTHISVVDSEGNAAAMTLSNGEGCGYILPGAGIMLNNMLGEEDINPHGFHLWPTDRRMSSMMAPTVLEQPEGSVTALGSGGSNRIRTAILQVMLNLFDFGMSVEEAVYAPRIHFEGGRLNVEKGFDEDIRRAFASGYDDAKLWEGLNLFFGGVHAVRLETPTGRLTGAGDPRRGGSAVVL